MHQGILDIVVFLKNRWYMNKATCPYTLTKNDAYFYLKSTLTHCKPEPLYVFIKTPTFNFTLILSVVQFKLLCFVTAQCYAFNTTCLPPSCSAWHKGSNKAEAYWFLCVCFIVPWISIHMSVKLVSLC